jgi:hypothetical protein
MRSQAEQLVEAVAVFKLSDQRGPVAAAVIARPAPKPRPAVPSVSSAAAKIAHSRLH